MVNLRSARRPWPSTPGSQRPVPPAWCLARRNVTVYAAARDLLLAWVSASWLDAVIRRADGAFYLYADVVVQRPCTGHLVRATAQEAGVVLDTGHAL